MENQLQEITQVKVEENKVIIMNTARLRDKGDRVRRSGVYIMLLTNRTYRVFKELLHVLLQSGCISQALALWQDLG